MKAKYRPAIFTAHEGSVMHREPLEIGPCADRVERIMREFEGYSLFGIALTLVT